MKVAGSRTRLSLMEKWAQHLHNGSFHILPHLTQTTYLSAQTKLSSFPSFFKQRNYAKQMIKVYEGYKITLESKLRCLDT